MICSCCCSHSFLALVVAYLGRVDAVLYFAIVFIFYHLKSQYLNFMTNFKNLYFAEFAEAVGDFQPFAKLGTLR